MQLHKDPAAIKLFGRNIRLPADGGGVEDEEETEKTEQVTEEVDVPTLDSEHDPFTEAIENPKTPSIDEEEAKPKLAKPDKILPCPRCNSMDTKFCYYNNYNVNQPRHFCRACQRYWTAGGTMRNVPVGAGRRKHKNSSSQYGHINISEVLQAAHLKSDGRVLSFAFDSPMCNSMAPAFSLGEKKPPNGTRDGLRDRLQERAVSVACRGGEKGDDCSSGSSITALNSMDEGGRRNVTEPGTRNFITWPNPWQSAPGFPMQFYPTALWSCGFSGPLNVPLLSPRSSSDQTSRESDLSTPKLGRHSREDNEEHLDTEKPRKQARNGSVLVPKTLRIGDPTEAAKSSIWTALGIRNESLGFGGPFKSKGSEMNCVSQENLIMRVNPAALCRSQSFQESS